MISFCCTTSQRIKRCSLQHGQTSVELCGYASFLKIKSFRSEVKLKMFFSINDLSRPHFGRCFCHSMKFIAESRDHMGITCFNADFKKTWVCKTETNFRFSSATRSKSTKTLEVVKSSSFYSVLVGRWLTWGDGGQCVDHRKQSTKFMLNDVGTLFKGSVCRT